jgi:hypothetical protein
VAANPILNIKIVVPDYFATFGISLVGGRFFTDTDREGAPLVVIVSRSILRHYWGMQDSIGRWVHLGRERQHTFTVVGVIPNTRYRELRDARPSIYFPLHQ